MDKVDVGGGVVSEREFDAFVENERVSDGVVGVGRAASCGMEIERAGLDLGLGGSGSEAGDAREALLARARGQEPLVNGWSLTPLDDKLLVAYTPFREGYVCEMCDGEGWVEGVCERCLGLKKIVRKEGWKPEDCPDCGVVGWKGREKVSSGKPVCGRCGGTGLREGLLAVPDESQQDHSYGDIVAVGVAVKDLFPGDRVMFSKMAGIYIRGDRNCCLMRRGEVLGYMRKVR